MTRLAALACALTIAGCAPDARSGDAHLEDLTTREVVVRVLVSSFDGESAAVRLHVDVTAPGASWASLVRADVPGCSGGTLDCPFSLTGPARRMTAGHADLELGDLLWTSRCASVCELDYVVRLDAAPTVPWDVVFSATVDGHTRDGASVIVTTR